MAERDVVQFPYRYKSYNTLLIPISILTDEGNLIFFFYNLLQFCESPAGSVV